MGSYGKASFNESGVYRINPIAAGTIPTYKKPMPMDQKSKLLAMHKAGRLNAGIYVAIVLAVYLILLTILLCRHSRKHHRPTSIEDSQESSTCCGFQIPPVFSTIISFTACCNKKSRDKIKSDQIEIPLQVTQTETSIDITPKPNVSVPTSSNKISGSEIDIQPVNV